MNEVASAKGRTPSSFIKLVSAFLPALIYAITSAIFLPTNVSIAEATPTEAFVVRVIAGLLIYAAIFVAILVLCVGANRLFMREKKRIANFWLFSCVVTVCLLLVGFRGAWFAQHRVLENQTAVSIPAGTGRAITTAVSAQNSHGITDSDLDQELLARIEDWILTTTVEKTRLVTKDPAFSAAVFRQQLNAQSVYVTLAGKKLAITKMRPPGTRMVVVTGIRGDELIRVLCVRDTDDEIVVVSGECGAAIEGAFAINLPAM